MLGYVVGNDGNITMPTSVHAGHIQTWAANSTRTVSDITGFEDTGRRRRLGVNDLQGNAVGSHLFNAATTSPGFVDQVLDGSSLTLTIATGCSIQATCVLHDIGSNVNKVGDSVLTFNFQMSGGAVAVETWDETP